MGTNYYWIEGSGPACDHCGRFDFKRKLHLGKSSAGWRFGFRAHGEPFDDIKLLSWADWKKHFETTVGFIEDEYREKVPVARFVDMVECKQRDPKMRSHVIEYGSHPHYQGNPSSRVYLDPDGYDFQTGEFS